MQRCRALFFALVFAWPGLSLVSSAQAPPALPSGSWDLSFASDQLNGTLYAMASDGTSLYVGGAFTDAGGNLDADGIARWDGQQWHAVGKGLSGWVNAIALDGNTLYAGGQQLGFGRDPEATHGVGNVVRWNGTAWEAFTPAVYGRVHALLLEGDDLYVGGQFSSIDEDRSLSNIARWDGQQWHPLTEGVDGVVNTIARHDGVLYAGGRFFNREAGTEHPLARWDGARWARAGPADEASGAQVKALTVHDGALYAAGWYLKSSSDTRHAVLRWDGTTWDGLLGNGQVYALHATGDKLYAAGVVRHNTPSIDGVASWDGTTWQVFENNATYPSRAYALTVHQGAIYAGGDMYGWGTVDRHLAQWQGNAWTALGRPGPFNVPPSELIVYKSDLIAGGAFTNAGGNPDADYLARWDGHRWHSMGDMGQAPVLALATDGETLYAGLAGSQSFELGTVVMWRDETWTRVGDQRFNGRVSDIALHDNEVYVSGEFRLHGEETVLLHWNGAVWRSLLPEVPRRNVNVLHHSGSNLYVAGIFTNLGGDPNIRHLARWDGQHWHDMGLTEYVDIRAITSHRGTVYVGGAFTNIDGVPNANGLAQWDGARWQRLGVGLQRTTRSPLVEDLFMTDGHLFVAGHFADAGHVAEADHIARWSAGTWHRVDSGLSGPASSLAFNALSQTLHVGGTFTSTGSGDVAMGFVGSYASPPLSDIVPTTLTLSAPAPNPTREISRFTLSAAETQEVDVVAYDMLGRVRERIYNGRVFAATPHPIIVDTRGWSSGTYIIRAQSTRSATTRRLTVIR